MRQKIFIYIVHEMPIGSLMFDFFILKDKKKGYYSYSNFIGEYWMSECEYVKKFLKSNPNYRYVGSSDSYNHKPRIPIKFRRFNEKVSK
jgi:hypothetical protein